MQEWAMRIAIVGDYDPTSETHRLTDAAFEHSAASLGLSLQPDWLPTDAVPESAPERALAGFSGILCAPGSPYRSKRGAIAALAYGRRTDPPVLGTCAGFQHMVLEFARNALGVLKADSTEYGKADREPFVDRLACSLVGQTLRVQLEAGSRCATAYGLLEAEERYYCRFGLEPRYADRIDAAGLRIVGRDGDGEARVLELADHAFFIGTLFVPQARSSPGASHPLVDAFVTVCADHASA